MRLLSALLGLLLAAIAHPAALAQTDLSVLTEQLTRLRTTAGVNQHSDAGPELTPVKQALRVWIEQQLPSPPEPTAPYQIIYSLGPEDLAALSLKLSETLDAARLTCGPFNSPDNRCPSDPAAEDDYRGYLGHVRIASLDYGRYLLVVTGIGIRCGFDESAYIYEEGPDHKWHLLFASEQNRYGEEEYSAQNFLAIDISPSIGHPDQSTAPPLVATLGFAPHCWSNWNVLYSRLWRTTTTTTTPAPLIDRTDGLYLGGDAIASTRLTDTDWLVEFMGESIDGDALVRQHVAHYLIQPGDKLERIAPIALNPGDFVEEWLTSDWQSAVRWIEPRANLAALAKLHATVSGQHLFGAFDGPPKRCRTDAALWQVGFADDPDAPFRYFKVRWMAPYRFAVVETATDPFPGCDKEESMPDDIGTLFPLSGWRP